MLTDIQKLRYELLKAAKYSLVEAEKYYDFIIKNEIECKSNNELTDGIYLMYYKTPVAYKGQKLSENEKNGCTGVGVKFGGKSLVVALNDIGDEDIDLTTQQGGTRFITNYHQAAEDMDGKAATDDIRDILNMGIADDEHIPSLGELYFMLAHFTQINAALEAVGGEPLYDDWYWSSTQYSAANAWFLDLSYGNAGGNTKATSQGRVRPVSAFPSYKTIR